MGWGLDIASSNLWTDQQPPKTIHRGLRGAAIGLRGQIRTLGIDILVSDIDGQNEESEAFTDPVRCGVYEDKWYRPRLQANNFDLSAFHRTLAQGIRTWSWRLSLADLQAAYDSPAYFFLETEAPGSGGEVATAWNYLRITDFVGVPVEQDGDIRYLWHTYLEPISLDPLDPFQVTMDLHWSWGGTRYSLPNPALHSSSEPYYVVLDQTWGLNLVATGG